MGKHADVPKEKRLQYIHKHLSLGAHATAAWFAERLGVSTKQIQRDLIDLDKETGGSLHWDRTERTYKYTAPAVMQNRLFICGEDEVTAFLLACSVMQGFTSMPLGTEMERLRQTFLNEKFNRLAHNQPNASKFSFIHPRMARVDPMIWKICVGALNHCHKIDIVYQKIGEEPERRRILPLHLRGAKGGWYLIAHCETAEAQRTFYMSRIRDAQDTGDEFSPANYKFEPDQFFRKKTDIFKASAFYSCEVQLKGWAAQRVGEITYFDGQRIEQKSRGTVTMTFETGDLYTAAEFVMSMAGAAKAIKPRELVEKVKENIRALARTHKVQ